MFYCELCDYQTEDRDRIHNHHIIPVSMGGPDAATNRLCLCPNDHARVWVEGAPGTHGIKGSDPVVIIKKCMSTAGMLIEYEERGELSYSPLKNNYPLR